jgi:uncharacterized linocin/CFP29 family protein
MNNDLVEAGWTDDQWSRILSVVTEEAQRARIAAQILPVVGPEDSATVAFSDFRLNIVPNIPTLGPLPAGRLNTNNVPNHTFTTIAAQVQLTSSEVADPNLEAALVKFRRAANVVARIEDAIAFNDRTAPGIPLGGAAGIPPVYQVTGGGPPAGAAVELGLAPLDRGFGPVTPIGPRQQVVVAGGPLPPGPPPLGLDVNITQAIIQAMSLLEDAGQSAPFACVLSPYFYEAVYTPNGNFVAAKDRILPILNGPLLRSSALTDLDAFNVPTPYGVVLALGGSPLALRVASDISVKFVQITEEPRYLFRVTERIGLRVTDPRAIAVLTI